MWSMYSSCIYIFYYGQTFMVNIYSHKVLLALDFCWRAYFSFLSLILLLRRNPLDRSWWSWNSQDVHGYDNWKWLLVSLRLYFPIQKELALSARASTEYFRLSSKMMLYQALYFPAWSLILFTLMNNISLVDVWQFLAPYCHRIFFGVNNILNNIH